MSDNVQLPNGFKLGVAEANIKHSGRKDVGLLISDPPASCAAVFTKNTFAAAPVHYSRRILQQSAGIVTGIVVNSGCANAATGDQGVSNTEQMARAASTACKGNGDFLVCSTGTIGVQLPMDKLFSGINDAASHLRTTPDAFIGFAECILTTDTVRKVTSTSFEVDGKTVTLTGCAKGSGMIHPDMATMLSFAVTDAAIDPHLLQQIFSRIIDRSLNCVTIDGDTSTNDTAILMANGTSGVHIEADTPLSYQFEAALNDLMVGLSKMLARDGEGATHLIEIKVCGAPTYADARKAALAVGSSSLVKTAIYGRDANWGRIACALGYSDVEFDPTKTDIRLGDLELMRAGMPLNFDEDRALQILSEEEVKITADLKAGSESATVWTCDLTEKYIEINGAYRT